MRLEELLQTCDVTFVLAIPTRENRELLTRDTLEQIGLTQRVQKSLIRGLGDLGGLKSKIYHRA